MSRQFKRPAIILVTLAAAGFAWMQVSGFTSTSEVSGGAMRGPGGFPGGGMARSEAAIDVDLATATAVSFSPVTTAYGRVTAPRRVEVVPETSGRVIFVAEGLRDGSSVAEGDVLLRIDSADAELAVREAHVALEAAEANLEFSQHQVADAREQLGLQEEMADLAKGDLERTQSMMERGVSSTSDLESARSSSLSARQSVANQRASLVSSENQVRQAQISVTQAQMSLEQAQADLEDHVLKAPISGDFSGASIVVGQMVTSSSLGELVDLDVLEVRLDLTQAALARVSGTDGRALSLDVNFGRPGIAAKALGRIDRLAIEEGDDGEDQTIAVAAVGAEGCDCLRPGDFVEATIREGEMLSVVKLPASALLGDGTIFVVDEAGKLQRHPVSVLRRIGDSVIVSDEIAGLEFVRDPGTDLSEGLQVKARPAQGPEMSARPGSGVAPIPASMPVRGE